MEPSEHAVRATKGPVEGGRGGAAPQGSAAARRSATLRAARARYDAPSFNAGRAQLARCKSVAEVRSEGAFFHLFAGASHGGYELERYAVAVLAFGSAPHRDQANFNLGAYLRRTLYREVAKSSTELRTRALRFRQLLAVRHDEHDALAQRLRRLLRVASGSERTPVDWGALGADLFDFASEQRRERVSVWWAQGLFVGGAPERATSDETTDAASGRAATAEGDR